MIYKVAAVRKHDLVPKSINHKIHLSFINLDFKLLSFIYFFLMKTLEKNPSVEKLFLRISCLGQSDV